jgi:hypothetical protein
MGTNLFNILYEQAHQTPKKEKKRKRYDLPVAVTTWSICFRQGPAPL